MEIVGPQAETSNDLAASHFEKKQQSSVEVRPAGFMRRVIAYTIDLCIIFVLFLVFMAWGLMGIQSSGDLDLSVISNMGTIVFLSFAFLYTGYFTFFHATGGQTPAKMILRIIVLNKEGLPPSYFRALMRSLGLFPSHLFFGLGFLLAIIGPKKRALHDLLSGTQVMLAP